MPQTRIIVEVLVPAWYADGFSTLDAEGFLNSPGFLLDHSYDPVPMRDWVGMPDEFGAWLVRGTVEGPDALQALRERRNVLGIYTDPQIEPFGL